MTQVVQCNSFCQSGKNKGNRCARKQLPNKMFKSMDRYYCHHHKHLAIMDRFDIAKSNKKAIAEMEEIQHNVRLIADEYNKYVENESEFLDHTLITQYQQDEMREFRSKHSVTTICNNA